MSDRPGTARNVLLMFLTQFASWAVTFVVMIYVPRYLGAAGLGKLTYVSNTVGLFGVLVTLGTGNVIIRSVSRDNSTAPSYLTNSYALCLPLAVIAGFMAYSFSFFGHYSPSTRVLLALAAISLFTGVFSGVNYNILQGLERFSKQNLVALVEKYFNSLLLLGLVFLKAKLWVLVLIGPVSNVVAAVYSSTYLRDVFAAAKPPHVKQIREMVNVGLPFLGFAIFRQLYGQTDPLIIRFVSTFQAVGWYAAAAKLIGATMIFPVSVSTVMLPVMSRQFQVDRQQFDASVFRFYKLMVLSSLPIALLTVAFARRFILLLHYGPSFANSIPVLQVGSIALVFFFVAMPFGSAVIATDKQVQLMQTAIIAAVIFIPTCFLASKLTGQYMGNAALGATVSDAIVEMVIITCYIRALPTGCVTSMYLKYALRCGLACAPMGALLWLGLKLRGLDLLVGLGAIVAYAAAAYMLGCIQQEDIQSVKNMISAKMGRTSS